MGTATAPSTDADPDTCAAQRGRTTISDRAVGRIAARVLTEVEHIGGTAGRILGTAPRGDGSGSSARVTAKVTGDSVAALDVHLSVAYPESVARATENARTSLVHRLAELTGLTVTRVDIDVTALRSADSPSRRVQ